MQAIDVTAIIQRLEALVFGDAGDMTEAQVIAALGLLDHALPSLVGVEVTVCEVNPVGVGQRVASKIEER